MSPTQHSVVAQTVPKPSALSQYVGRPLGVGGWALNPHHRLRAHETQHRLRNSNYNFEFVVGPVLRICFPAVVQNAHKISLASQF